MKFSGKWFLRIIGLLLFAYIITRIDVPKVLDIFKKSNSLAIFGILIMIIVLTFLVRAYKWKLLIKDQNMEVSYFQLLSMFCSSYFVSVIVPGRIGEFIRIFFLQKKGHSFPKSSISVIVDRFQDVIILIIMGCFGLLYFSSIFIDQFILIVGLLLIGTIGLIIFFMSKKLRCFIFDMIVKFLIPKKYKEKTRNGFDEFILELKKIKISTHIITAIVSLAAWMIFYVMFYWVALLMGIDVTLFQIIIISSISSLVTTLPLSFSGLGTRDAIFILLFAQLGIASEEAIAFSTSIFFMYILSGVFGLGFWLHNPVYLNDKDAKRK